MQDHNIPLSLFIISVYILTVLVLWNIFSKGHITVMSCLFLLYNPSTLPEKVWKAGKVLMHHYEFEIFCLFPIFKMVCFSHQYKADSKRSTVRPNISCISCHCILIFVHCQVQSLCWTLFGEVISIPNLRTTCLRCILSPTSFQFFENFQKQQWRKA